MEPDSITTRIMCGRQFICCRSELVKRFEIRAFVSCDDYFDRCVLCCLNRCFSQFTSRNEQFRLRQFKRVPQLSWFVLGIGRGGDGIKIRVPKEGEGLC